MSYDVSIDQGYADSGELLMAYQAWVVIVVILTIIPILMCVSTFINKKIFKIISVIALLMTTILFYIFRIEIASGMDVSYDPTTTNVLRGPADTVILIGLVMMLGGSCYSLYKFIQKNNRKTSSL